MNRILVVDDKDYIRSLLVDILGEWGYETGSAVDGLDAIDKVERSRWDLIISDMDMPGLDGMELLERLKSIYPSIPVILMSGRRMRDREKIARSIGAVGFMYKPFRFEQMEKLIGKVLGKHMDVHVTKQTFRVATTVAAE